MLLPVDPESDPTARSRIYLFPRQTTLDKALNAKAWEGEVTTTPKVLYAPPCFAYHHVNAFEDEDGNVVLDSLAFSKFCPHVARNHLSCNALALCCVRAFGYACAYVHVIYKRD